MNRSFYLHLASAQEFDTAASASTAETVRLAAILRMIAALPAAGGIVLTSSAHERAEIGDLILQHRGVRVSQDTKVVAAVSATVEFGAVAGLLSTKVFLAPGYEPKAGSGFWQGALEFNCQGGWWKPAGASAYKTPGTWREAEPEAGAAGSSTMQDASPVYAKVSLAPLPDGPANDRGAWHKPQVGAAFTADPIVTITMRSEPGHACPFELRAWLSPACLTCLMERFATQDAADAALPAFAARVRAAQAVPDLAQSVAMKDAA